MTLRKTLPALAVLLAAAGSVAANPGNSPAHGASGFCPPGLANKNPPCIPPGQAAKYGIGDIITEEYIIFRNPGRLGLDPRDTYVEVGDFLYRVNPDTRAVLDIIGALNVLMN